MKSRRKPGIMAMQDNGSNQAVQDGKDQAMGGGGIGTAAVTATEYGATRALLWQYRIILSADTASEVRQMLSQKRR